MMVQLQLMTVPRSVEPKLAVDRADLGRLDQARVCHRNRVQRALELFQPEIEEFVQRGKPRTNVVVLPNVGL